MVQATTLFEAARIPAMTWRDVGRYALVTASAVFAAVILTLGFGIAHPATASAATCDHTWNGSVSSAWGTAANWDEVTLPAAGSYVCIVAGDHDPIIAGSVSVAGIALSSNLTVNGSLNLTGSAVSSTMSGGTLNGSGTVTAAANHSFTWTGGTMSGTGKTVISAGASLAIQPGGGVYMGRTLQNDGSASYVAADLDVPGNFGLYFGDCTGADTADFVNNGSFDYQGVAASGNDAGILPCSTLGTFKNKGSFTKSSGTGDAVLYPVFDNTGTVSAAAGRLSLGNGDSGSTTNGSFATSGSARIAFINSGTFHLGASTNLSNGRYAVTGADVRLASTTSAASFNISGGTLTVNGSLNLTGSAVSSTMSGGTLNGSGTVTAAANHSFTWTGGTMSGTGKTVISAGASLAIQPGGGVYMGRTLQNDGSASYVAADLDVPGNFGLYFGDCTGADTADFVNNGSFDYQGVAASGNDAGILPCSTLGTFKNKGSFTKSSGTGDAVLYPVFDNTGTVTVSKGVLRFAGAFPAYTVASFKLVKGTYIANSPGEIQIDGVEIHTLSASVTLNGASAKLSDEAGTNGFRNLAAIDATGSLTITNGKTLAATTSVSNAGTLTIGGGANSKFAPTGTYTQTAGTTALLSATSSLAPTGASKVIINGGVLKGIGEVVATGSPGLTVGGTGTLAPGLSPGPLTVTGSYKQQGSATLAIEVSGIGAGQADKLVVSETATLGGVLAIDSTGYTPELDDQVQILTASSVSGTFASVTGAALPNKMSFRTIYNPANVTLKVVRPSISVADVPPVFEGNSGTTDMTFTVILSEQAAVPVSVDWGYGGRDNESRRQHAGLHGCLRDPDLEPHRPAIEDGHRLDHG